MREKIPANQSTGPNDKQVLINQPIGENDKQVLINQSTNQLTTYTLHLADNALILGQRNAEWTGHGPILEQDIAISNISLDLVGQARNFYQYAAVMLNHETGKHTIQPATEDSLAFLRDAADYKNSLLVELPRGDWALTILRQFFFSSYQFYLYQELQNSKDAQLAAIAQKSLKEVTYHLRWSAEWVIRLGDGTAQSHTRISHALQELWPYTGELTTNAIFETALLPAGIAVDMVALQQPWTSKINEVLATATLQLPENNALQTGGKEGKHTGHLEILLKEMQYLQRTYPGVEW